MNIASDVIDFNQIILGIDPRAKSTLEHEEFEISHRCLQEELDEFIHAHKKDDLIGCVDAILDGVYFAMGILYKMGLSDEEINQCFAAIHLANMTKKIGVNAKRDTGAADAVKPEGWQSPEVKMAEILCLDQ
jgi:predicted HAD superfamily Cof-like phosphohydrolase